MAPPGRTFYKQGVSTEHPGPDGECAILFEGTAVAAVAGEPVADCLRRGNACGALSTRELGGIAGMPTKAQLKEFLCAE